jgi:hypothetical protein
VPRIRLVDLREMVLRIDAAEGFYGPKGEVLRSADLVERTRRLGLGRSVYAGLRLVEELFPEASANARRLALGLPSVSARLVEEAVVRPALDPRRTHVVRAVTALRRVLLA